MTSAWPPVIVRAVFAGAIVATLGTVPWALLVAANLRWSPQIPWAVPITALYLWLFWRYFNGAGWPASTADARRANFRARQLAPDVWAAAIVAGLSGLGSVMLLLQVLGRLVALPQQQVPDLSGVSTVTLLAFLVMSSLVAGIAEEGSFRGYMQRPIERRHGPAVAILITGTFFGLAHFTHPEVTLALMPYYVAVAAVYGGLAYLTDSILPGLVLHAGGNFLLGVGLLTGGRSEWQVGPRASALIWETGADASFWLSLAALLVVGTLAGLAYRQLALVSREEPATVTA